MKANAAQLTGMLRESIQFRIPSFQRPASWDGKRVIALANSFVERAEDRSLGRGYLGAITYKLSGDQNNPIWEISDGQQRLTTLHMIAKAILLITSEEDYKLKVYRETTSNNGLLELDPEKPVDEIKTQQELEPMIQYLPRFADTPVRKLRLRGSDDQDLARVMNLTPKDKIPSGERRVLENFAMLYNHLEQLHKQVDENGVSRLGRLWNGMHKTIVVLKQVEHEKGEWAQDIYDVENYPSLPVTIQHRLWNLLTMSFSDGEIERLLQTQWEPAERQISEAHFSKMILHLAIQYREGGNAQVDSDDLYSIYRSYLLKNGASRELRLRMIEDITENARIYRKLVTPDLPSLEYPRQPSEERRHILEQVHQLGYYNEQDGNWDYPISDDIFLPVTLLLRRLIELDKVAEADYVASLEVMQAFSLHRKVSKLNKNDSGSQSAGMVSIVHAIVNVIREHLKAGGASSELRNIIRGRLLETTSTRAWPEQESVLTGLIHSDPGDRILRLFHTIVDRVLSGKNGETIGGNRQLDHLSSRITDRNRLFKGRLGNTAMTNNNAQLATKEFEEKVDLPEYGYAFSKSESNKELVKFYRELQAQGRIWDERAINENTIRLAEIIFRRWPVPEGIKREVPERHSDRNDYASSEAKQLSQQIIDRIKALAPQTVESDCRKYLALKIGSSERSPRLASLVQNQENGTLHLMCTAEHLGLKVTKFTRDANHIGVKRITGRSGPGGELKLMFSNQKHVDEILSILDRYIPQKLEAIANLYRNAKPQQSPEELLEMMRQRSEAIDREKNRLN